MRLVAKADGYQATDEFKQHLTTNWRNADLKPIDKQILDYAERLTKEPTSITPEYIDNLRTNGFDDQMLHDAVQVIAYFNYVNRLADGLGVELESE